MLKIGVTGNIGAGKTQVCRIFELLDIPVYYADAKAKNLMTSKADLIEKIKTLLGEKAYFNSGDLNPSYIGKIIFDDKNKLARLNALIHPEVARDFKIWFENFSKPYVIKEAALLFESGSYKQLDFTILVTANEHTRIQRVASRDGLTELEIRKRMANQMKQEEKLKLADFVVDNDGKTPLLKQVLALHSQFVS